jgi:type III secretion protein U
MSDDKKHPPSDKRLDDSRKKGQVSQSKDITHLFATWVMFEVVFALEGTARRVFIDIIDNLMRELARNTAFLNLLESLALQVLIFFAVISVIVLSISVLCHLLGTWGQIGFLIAPEALAPNFEKFNPIGNLKNMFAPKALTEFLLNLAKVCVISYMIYSIVYEALAALVLLPTGTIEFSYETAMSVVKKIVRNVMVLFIPIAAIDFGIQRHFYMKNLMMSDKEVMDEYKEMEGDPHVKGERKQFGHEIVFGEDPVPNTAQSDAVVVNPEHYAIALSYRPEKFPLPIIVARGYDQVARDMIAMAQQNNIPVVRYVWLARTLYANGHVNKRIPKMTLRAVAMIYQLITKLKSQHTDFTHIQSVDEKIMYRDLSEM